MAGLNLHGNAGFGLRMNGTPTAGNPVTASQAAFGPGMSGGSPSTGAALAPNDPFGVAFWLGVGSLALLLLIRHSLPA